MHCFKFTKRDLFAEKHRCGIQSDFFKDTVLKSLCSLCPLRQCFYLSGLVCHPFMTWQERIALENVLLYVILFSVPGVRKSDSFRGSWNFWGAFFMTSIEVLGPSMSSRS